MDASYRYEVEQRPGRGWWLLRWKQLAPDKLGRRNSDGTVWGDCTLVSRHATRHEAERGLAAAEGLA